MPESTRKRILDAALKALLAASDTAWWLKAPATFVAELAPKFDNLPDEQRLALSRAEPRELREAILQLENAAELREAVASGLVRIESLIKALRDDVSNQIIVAATLRAFAENFAGALETIQSTIHRIDKTTTHIETVTSDTAADVKQIKATIIARRDEWAETLEGEKRRDDSFPVFGVPFHRNQYFTGRNEVLSNLRQTLTEGGKRRKIRP